MQKIPTLFERDPNRPARVIPRVTPGCEWVLAGEGWATRKWDGTACMVREGWLYKRYDARNQAKPPAGFIAASPPDGVHWLGWIPVGLEPEDKYHREAWCRPVEEGTTRSFEPAPPDGTYELIGPKVQGGKEPVECHMLVPHGAEVIPDAPRGFEELKEWFQRREIEGIVWYHDDGRRAKIKKRDFGLPW